MHRRDPVHFSEIRSRRSARRIRFALAIGLGLCLAAASRAQAPSVASLLDAAEQAERRGQLIYPAEGSAMSLYHEVLYYEPDNEHAVEGLTRLAEHYLEQAQTALDAGNLLKADTLVSQARMIFPEYPAVASLARQIERVENAEHHRQTLNWRQVADRSSALTPTLVRLGDQAKRGDCRVTINVSNDAEGRWVYQQMNRSTADGRLRAEVKIASPAAVDILCFRDDAEDDSEEVGTDRAP
jgi:hypothetical protein